MPEESRPNILLITTDQQRMDTLGCYGSRQVKTPHLDALAARGVVFRRAYTQNPVCIPARCSWMTGRYIHQHGVTHMEETIDDTPLLPEHEVTVPQLLQSAGYRTAAFGKTHVWPERGYHEKQTTGGKGVRWVKSAGLPIGLAPLGRDYAGWLEQRHPGAYETIYAQRRRPEYRQCFSAIDNVLPLEEYVDYWTAENTISFIARKHDRPWFAWCGFCSPHDPMDPPEPYCRMFDPATVELPPNYGIDIDGAPRPTTPEQDRVARWHIAHYWGLCAMLDDLVGRVLRALDESGQAQRTLIVFVSDHGEMLWERGRLAKAWFFDPIIRVPLIVVPPRGAGEGRRVDGIVETFDVAPTMLDYARAGIPSRMTASTLRPLVEGSGTGKPVALSHYVGSKRDFRTLCAVTERFKYIWADGVRKEEFFDLVSDPLERVNRLNDPACADEIARLRKLMIDRLAGDGLASHET
jgi:arylsulfatase A-like enzyme